MSAYLNKANVVITGGSSGIGLAMADQLARQGCRVLLIARDVRKLDNAVQQILAQKHAECVGFPGDITSVPEMERIAAEIFSEFGRIDFLIANAGVANVNLVEVSSYDHLKQNIEIDLWGTIVTAKSFLPLLSAGGRILFISSGFGLVGAAGYASYCAAKAGVIAFAEALKREVRCKAISVYVACPSDVDTPQYHAEQAAKPDWMKRGVDLRVAPMPASVAAQKILKKCWGNRFLITITPDVFWLNAATKLLPRRLRDWILDRSLPRPT